MLNVSARPFMSAVSELRSVQLAVHNFHDQATIVTPEDRTAIEDHLGRLSSAIEAVGGKLAQRSVQRLLEAIQNPQSPINYQHLGQALQDIESRFADYLDEIKMFIVADHETKWLAESDDLIGLDIFGAFPSCIFEFEEAAKCIALGRYTASAFHSMRVLEVGIRTLGTELDIEDPIAAGARNWGTLLTLIKSKIDE